jgi:hypothetical protein
MDPRSVPVSSSTRIEIPWFRRNRASFLVMMASRVVAMLKLWLACRVGSLAVMVDGMVALAAGARSAYLLSFIDAAVTGDEVRTMQQRRRGSLAVAFVLAILLILTGWELLGAALIRLMRPVELPILIQPLIFAIGGLTLVQLGFYLTARRCVPLPDVPVRMVRRWVAWTPAASVVSMIAMLSTQMGLWLDPVGAMVLIAFLFLSVALLLAEAIRWATVMPKVSKSEDTE